MYLLARLAAATAIAEALLLGAAQPAFAVNNRGWAGGWNNYVNRGVKATIETADPYSPSPGDSSAWVMTLLWPTPTTPDGEYIQIGWLKDVDRSVYRP